MSTAGVSATPTEAEALEVFVRSFLQDLYTAIPAKVVEYDAEKQKIVAQPMVKRALETINGGELVEELPTIPDVPVAFPRNRGFALTFPLEPGDRVLLLFSMRSIDTYLASSDDQPVDPIDFRIHDITDAIALPGVFPDALALKNAVSTQSMALGSDTGAGVAYFKAETVNVGAEDPADAAPLDSKVQSELDSLRSALNDLVTQYNAHVHPGVAPGQVSTGSTPAVATPPPAVGSTASQVLLVDK